MLVVVMETIKQEFHPHAWQFVSEELILKKSA